MEHTKCKKKRHSWFETGNIYYPCKQIINIISIEQKIETPKLNIWSLYLLFSSLVSRDDVNGVDK